MFLLLRIYYSSFLSPPQYMSFNFKHPSETSWHSYKYLILYKVKGLWGSLCDKEVALVVANRNPLENL